MLLSVGKRHENADVTPFHLKCCPPEQFFCSGAERLYRPLFVNDDHGVWNGGKDCLKVCFAASQFLLAGRKLLISVAKMIYSPLALQKISSDCCAQQCQSDQGSRYDGSQNRHLVEALLPFIKQGQFGLPQLSKLSFNERRELL